MVDRGAVDRVPAERPAQAGGAELEGQVRSLPNPLRSQADAAGQIRRYPTALCGRAADGRGHAPAGPVDLRAVWRDSAESERSAHSHGDSVEVRFQER